MKKMLCTLLGLVLLPLALRADLIEAKGHLDKGIAFERDKKYSEALAEYEWALKSEPGYHRAWRQIGNCRYHLGDKPGALQAYDTYIAAVDDEATRGYADRLRASIPGSPSAPPRPGAAPAAAMPENAMGGALSQNQTATSADKRWRVGLDFGYQSVNFKGFNDFWKSFPSAPGSDIPSIEGGVSFGLKPAYRILPALDLGLDLDWNIVGMKVKITGLTYEDNVTYDFSTVWLGPSVVYHVYTFPNDMVVNVGLGVGYMTMVGAGAKSDRTSSISGKSSSTTTYSGSTVGFRAKVGWDWPLKEWLVGNLDLGYRFANISKVDYKTTTSSGGSSSGTLKDSNNADMPFDYSGLDMRAGLNLRF